MFYKTIAYCLLLVPCIFLQKEKIIYSYSIPSLSFADLPFIPFPVISYFFSLISSCFISVVVVFLRDKFLTSLFEFGFFTVQANSYYQFSYYINDTIPKSSTLVLISCNMFIHLAFSFQKSKCY